jgi:hypothetical protein
MADVQIQQTPPPAAGGGSGTWVLGVVAIVVLLLVAWLVFGRSESADTGVDIDVPEAQAPKADAPDVEVKVPEKVDVNVKQQ